MPASPAVPSPPGALPGIGHGLRFFRDPLGFLTGCAHQGDLVRIRLGPADVYLVNGAAPVRRLLVTDGRFYGKGGPSYEAGRSLAGNGLLMVNGRAHRWQRRLMQPAFTPAQVARYAVVMSEETGRWTGRWRPGQTLPLFEEASASALRVVARALLPTADPDGLERLGPALYTLLTGVLRRAVVPAEWAHRVPTPGNLRIRRAHADFAAITDRIIADARDAWARDPAEAGLLGVLISAGKEDTEGEFSDLDLRHQAFTLLAAGSDTTAATVSWAFHLLAQHPEAEARLHAEVDEVLAGRVAGPTDLDRLGYTRQVVAETLRRYPPAWSATRTAQAEVEVGGRWFPAGTDFMFSPYLLHHDPTLFPEPERFDPDRFAPERIGSMPRDGYIPFASGTRKCIGDGFGLAQAVIAVATVAANWRLRHAPGAPAGTVRPLPRATLTPRGLRMVVAAR